MEITIKTLKGDMFKVEVEAADTIGSVKQKISNMKADHDVERQKLIHAGKVLKDSSTVGETGINPGDFIVCMISAKPKGSAATPAPAPVTSTPAPAPAASSPPAVAASTPSAPVAFSPATSATPLASAPAVSNASPPASAPADQVNPEVLANLTNMGFPEQECRAALSAAMGNADMAVEFLMNGIPPGVAAAARARAAAPASRPPAPAVPAPPATGVAALDAFRQHPQFNQLKQLVQQNPAAITQVMDAIGRQNPALLEAIHANHDAFVAMMNEPIGSTPPAPPTAPMPGMGGMGGANPNPAHVMQMLAALPVEQRNQLAQSMGMTPQQLQGVMAMMSSMPPEQLAAMTSGMMGGPGGAPGGGNVVRLTEAEMASVNNLMELGFSQQEAAQAFLACDRNEALAANLLLEGGWQDGGDMGDDMGDDMEEHDHDFGDDDA